MTDNRLLTPDALRAIEARAEAYEKASEMYTETCDTAFWLNTPETRDVEYDARIALDRAEDEFDTHARADIPALLAHIRAQDAVLARMRADLAIIEQGCNSPWMTGAAFKDRVADLFAARRRVLAGDKTDEGE